MAWCYYCRVHTVNGKCPKCGRLYEDPNKSYDYYGKEKESSNNQSGGISVSHDGWRGFWLGMGICFVAIIIAAKHNKRMLGGAIVGAIVSSFIYVNIITTIVLMYLNYLGIYTF